MATTLYPLVFALAVLCGAVTAQNDNTVKSGEVGEAVVIATVDKIRESGRFRDDFQFLRRMAKLETDYGKRTSTGGIWNYRKPFRFLDASSLKDEFSKNCRFAKQEDGDLRIPLCSALAVMLYLERMGEHIPPSIEGQADFWNMHFSQDSLTTEDFIDISRALNRGRNSVISFSYAFQRKGGYSFY